MQKNHLQSIIILYIILKRIALHFQIRMGEVGAEAKAKAVVEEEGEDGVIAGVHMETIKVFNYNPLFFVTQAINLFYI